MSTTPRNLKAAVAVSALAVCLAAMAAPVHGQRQLRAVKRPANATTVTDLDNATRFTRELVQVKVAGRQWWMPPHVAGDRDFDGHGPYVRVQVQFLVHNNAVYRRVYMQALEKGGLGNDLGSLTGGGGTKAEGWSPMQHVWTPPAGTTIVELRGINEKTWLVSEILDGHGEHKHNTKLGQMTIVGDTDGKDAGWRTHVEVNYDYVLPVVVQRYSNPNYVRVQFPRTVKFTPPHTNGDRDFKGHGPRVGISVWLEHSRRELSFIVGMSARETKSDWTTASGRYTKVIYTAPQGKYIKGFLGKQSWDNLVNYTDTDHEVDTFRRPLFGEIKIWGDTLYNDAGVSTKVIFTSIQHSVLVELGDE